MDNIIDDAFEAEPPEVVNEEAVHTDEQAETPENETTEQEEKRLTEAEWLRKERNLVSREGKRLAKLRQQRDAVLAEIGSYKQQQPPAPQQQAELKEPQEGDYKNYHEYIRALEKFDRAKDLRALRDELTAKETHSVREYQEKQWEIARNTALDQAGEEYAKQVPNFTQMVADNAAIIQSFPDSIKRVIKEVDAQDVVKAFHAMVENDTLEDLADMTPVQAAAAIVRAANMPKKPASITKAPAPMTSARGTGQGQKTIHRMSPQEIVDWVNS